MQQLLRSLCGTAVYALIHDCGAAPPTDWKGRQVHKAGMPVRDSGHDLGKQACVLAAGVQPNPIRHTGYWLLSPWLCAECCRFRNKGARPWFRSEVHRHCGLQLEEFLHTATKALVALEWATPPL